MEITCFGGPLEGLAFEIELTTGTVVLSHPSLPNVFARYMVTLAYGSNVPRLVPFLEDAAAPIRDRSC